MGSCSDQVSSPARPFRRLREGQSATVRGDSRAELGYTSTVMAMDDATRGVKERLTEVLGADLLARLVRDTGGDEEMARARLSYLDAVVYDLEGAFTAVGIRSWFTRLRPRFLDGLRPIDLLCGDWDPSSPGAVLVARAAGSLDWYV